MKRLFFPFTAVLFSLSVLLALPACDDDGKKNNDNTNNLNNTNNQTCDDLECGDHGDCVDAAAGAYCACDEGWQGTTCDACAAGYEPDGDACVPIDDPYFGTPLIDGTINEGAGDWSADQKVGQNSDASDWGANVLTGLYVAYDDANLYVGVAGFVEAQNALAVYVDLDYGTGSQGLASLAATSDNDGGLDNALSSVIELTNAEFRADWAVGTKGMTSAGATLNENAGWRDLAIEPANFHWMEGTLVTGAAAFEASIPLATLYGGAAPAEGTRLAVFARLVNEDGQYLANQTAPADNATAPASVSQVAVVTLHGGGAPVCDDDGVCEAGETTLNCPGDCPDTGECGDNEVFAWEDGVMYFVLVDRFFDSDGLNQPVDGANWEAQFQGGDWNGVEEKLSYLAGLGVNTIWLSAPYKNRDYAGSAIDPVADTHLYSAYHGYWPSPANVDYTDPLNPQPTPAVEGRLGTATDLQAMIASARAEDMHILFDYVMNHVDEASGLFGAHRDWFYLENNNPVLCSPNYWNDPYYGTRCAFTTYLPAFDYYQDWVRAWSIADAIWWAREYGIDGYRLDAIKHVPMNWLTDLRTAAEAAFPNPEGGRFYMVGETYDWDSQQTLKDFVDPATKLDGQFDFPLRKRMCEAIFTRGMSLDDFFNWWNGNDTFYGAGALMSTWIGNHDIPRAIHFASGQITNCYEGSYVGNSWNPGAFTQPGNAEPYQRLALAFGLLLTNRGVPLIYYGDEIGMAGGGDPDNRRMMTWSGLNTHQEWLRARVSKLTAIRKANVALRRGRRVTVTGGADTFAYKLTGCGADQELYVLVNRGDFDASVSGLPAGSFTELISETTVSGGAAVTVPARDLMIFKAQ